MTLRLASQHYEVLDTAYESGHTVVYRARDKKTGAEVILKAINQEFPSPGDIARLHHEAKLIERLKGAGFPKCLGYREEASQAYLVFQQESELEFLDKQSPPELGAILEIAIRFCDVLGKMHAAGITHKDIKPANLAWNRRSNEVVLFDFGISTELSSEKKEARAVGALEGTLAYLSPEQTGRMNRVVDYRSDYYSFGVTLYELLTGSLPFIADDAMGMVHAQITKAPEPPHLRNPRIPVVLSKIVLKLMAKNAEDRYQSSGGMKRDFERCLEEWNRSKAIADFPIAAHDVSSRFQFPQKLYGREKEVEFLLASYASAISTRSELLLVKGFSGVGKSALVAEIHKPITASRGAFASGKFDQFKRNVPYSALSQALGELVHSLMTKSEHELAQWKENILQAVGQNGQLMVELIPELTAIIGPQPPVDPVEPSQAQTRFQLVFEKFIDVFADTRTPLVLFLDDLQWADGPTLSLIKVLMSNRTRKALLLVGAYRDNEVDAHHPLQIALDELNKDGASIKVVTVSPLTEANVTDLLREGFSATPERASELSRLVTAKTGGNPFFISQFLENLIDTGLIYFAFDQNRWNWDIDKIRSAGTTENVVELMVAKLRRLPEDTQEAAQMAACIGNVFSVDDVALVSRGSIFQVAKSLWPAVEAGVLLPMNDGLKLLVSVKDEQKSFSEPATVRFLHDRVQQAAYSLIDEKDREKVHLTIGREMLRDTTPEQRHERLFDIVLHLNRARSLIVSEQEITTLVDLNLAAAARARASVAFKPLLEFTSNACEGVAKLAAPKPDAAELSYLGKAEAQYLNGNHEDVEPNLQKAATFHQGLYGEVKAALIRIAALAAQNKPMEAIHAGFDILIRCGVHMPFHPSQLDVVRAALGSRIRLAFRNTNAIKDMPLVTDPVKLGLLEVMEALVVLATTHGPNELVIVICRQLKSLLDDGLSPLGIGSLIYFQIVLCILGDVKLAKHLDDVAQPLLEKHSRTQNEHRHLVGIGFLMTAWRWTSWGAGAKLAAAAAEASQADGNLDLTCVHQISKLMCGFLANETLTNWCADRAALHAYCDKYNLVARQLFIRTVFDGHHRLAEPDWDGHASNGEYFDEKNLMRRCEETHEPAGLMWVGIMSALLDVIFCKPVEAVAKIDQVTKLRKEVPPTGGYHVYFFVDGMASVAAFRTTRNRKHLKRARKSLAFFQKLAKGAPYNFLQAALLLDAELQSVAGKNDKAAVLYERAITVAIENGTYLDTALASERYAEHCLRVGDQAKAVQQIKQTRFHCERWGALAKVRDLDRRYAAELSSAANTSSVASDVSVSKSSSQRSTMNSGSNALDLGSVMKASNIIAAEIELQRLLAKMMNIVAENAGADRVVIVLDQESFGQHSLMVQASWVEGSQTRVMQAEPLDHSPDLCVALTRLVARSREPVVLGNAAEVGAFATDPYVQQHRAKSVLGLPILNQGQLMGVVYLENRLAQDTFTPARLEVLKMLCAQIAVSLANALLYAQLGQKVEERTTELRQTVEQLKREKEVVAELAVKVERAKIQQLETEKIALTKDLEVTAAIQTMLLPKSAQGVVGRLSVSGYYRSAEQSGGDWWWYDQLPDGRLIVLMGDVTGHGAGPAMVTAAVASSYHTLLRVNSTLPVAEIIENLNATLMRLCNDKYGMTLLVVVIDPKDQTLSSWSAGAPALVIVKPEQDEAIVINARGTPMGYDVVELGKQTCAFQPRDRLLLYTDGVTELTVKKTNRFLGVKGLVRLAREVTDLDTTRATARIVSRLDELAEDLPQADDITFTVVDYN